LLISKNMPPETVKNSNKSALVVVIILIIAFGAFFLLKKQSSNTDSTDKTPQGTQEKVDVKEVDLSKVTGDGRVPTSFPDDLPLDASSITKSYVADFPERGVTQNTISYNSTKKRDALYKEYLTYMTKNGYTFAEDGQNETLGALYGTKDNDDLSIIVRSEGSLTVVDITYLDRK